MINITEFSSLKNFVCATAPLKNELAKIAIDNRFISDENVFVAIIGERYNPLTELFKLKGKIKYIVHENNLEVDPETLSDFVFIKVKSIIGFCQEAASKISTNFQRTHTLFAIAGSNGKTTTKEILDHALSANKIAHIATQKNNNNHLGVPITLFQIRDNTEYAIIELGSNHPGEMEVLNSICHPEYGVVTNVGYTHMEFFPKLEDVFDEEKNIYDHIKETDTKKLFFRNDDDAYLSNLTGDFCISFGYKGKDYSFTYENQLISITTMATNLVTVIKNEFITGKHNFYNLAVCYVILKNITKIPEADLVSALASFKPTSNRGEWKEVLGKKVFLDAYNANPSSMLASVEGFVEEVSRFDSLANAVLILGDMNELGDKSEVLHKEVADKLSELGLVNVRFIGRYAQSYLKGYPQGKSFKDARQYQTDAFEEDIKNYNYFLIKGSRSLQLESILDIK